MNTQQEEPTDETLIERAREQSAKFVERGDTQGAVEFLLATLGAAVNRLASKDEALANAQGRIAELEAKADDRHESYRILFAILFPRYWPIGGSNADLSGRVRDLLSQTEARAKAALAECRAKVIEECAEAADTPETTNDFQRGMCFAATMIRALATKEAET